MRFRSNMIQIHMPGSCHTYELLYAYLRNEACPSVLKKAGRLDVVAITHCCTGICATWPVPGSYSIPSACILVCPAHIIRTRRKDIHGAVSYFVDKMPDVQSLPDYVPLVKLKRMDYNNDKVGHAVPLY